jgi:hypothetical protein
VPHPRARIDVGASRIRRADPSRGVGKVSLHDDPPLIPSLFRDVKLTFSLSGTDTRGVWSEESACGQRAPRGAGPVGDVAGGGSRAAAAAMASEATTWTTLKAVKQSVEDRTTAAQSTAATAAQSTAATAATERCLGDEVGSRRG